MKKFLAIAAFAVLALGACSNKEDKDSQQVAAAPVDGYCLNYGYYDQSRCPGIGYNGFGYNGGYGYGGGYYGGYGYGGGYGYSGWAGYNYYSGNAYAYSYNYGGCPAGYAPVYSNYGMACYYVQPNMNYYYWAGAGAGYSYGGYPGFLVACGYDVTGMCPSGLVCSNSSGAGVCVR